MMPDLTPFADWLAATPVSMFVQNTEWVWPTCEAIHFIGLALVIGSIGMVDLRLLGVEKQLPFESVHRFVRWGILGFLVNLATGLLFFAGSPHQYISNAAFGWKLLFLGVAGVNILLFYGTGLFRAVETLAAGEDAPLRAKIVGATSLFCWAAVMYMGRMLPYIGNAF